MAPKVQPEVDRFWAKVDQHGPMCPWLGTRCWLWTAYRDRDGYGKFRPMRPAGISRADRKQVRAHRYSYELQSGVKLGRLQIDHRCHNRACVNPGHLRLATTKQNLENLRGAYRNNASSGVRGVNWNKDMGRWAVKVGHNGVRHFGGYHDTLEEAGRAAVALRNKLYTYNDLDRVG